MNKTYFIDYGSGASLGTLDFVLPATLWKGMLFTIAGTGGNWRVVDWNFHYGHSAVEKPGLRIILKAG